AFAAVQHRTLIAFLGNLAQSCITSLVCILELANFLDCWSLLAIKALVFGLLADQFLGVSHFGALSCLWKNRILVYRQLGAAGTNQVFCFLVGYFFQLRKCGLIKCVKLVEVYRLFNIIFAFCFFVTFF